MIALILAAAVFAGVGIAYARRLDRMDEYHLMHGPNDGCPECDGK